MQGFSEVPLSASEIADAVGIPGVRIVLDHHLDHGSKIGVGAEVLRSSGWFRVGFTFPNGSDDIALVANMVRAWLEPKLARRA